MARTVKVQNSDEVMAMLGEPGTFYKGRWQKIVVTKIGEDDSTPLEVRKSLVGLTIPTIFSKEHLDSQGVDLKIPSGSRLSYVPDIIQVLRSVGKDEEANQLERISPNPLDMYIFEDKTYQVL